MLMKSAMAVTVLAIGAGAASADSLPQGLTFSSESRLEYSNGGGSNLGSLLSEMNASYLMPGNGALSFGVNAGYQSLNARTDGTTTSNTGFYLEGVVSGGFGTLALGKTRSAIEVVMPSAPEFVGNGLVELTLSTLFGNAQQVARLDGESSTGLRFDGAIAEATVAVSYNRYTDGTKIAEIAAVYPVGDLRFSGAIQYDVNEKDALYVLGASGKFGQVDAGFAYSELGSDGYVAARGYATYHLTEQLQGTLQVINFDEATVTSADVKYTTEVNFIGQRKVFGQMGVARSSDAPNTLWSVGLGTSF